MLIVYGHVCELPLNENAMLLLTGCQLSREETYHMSFVPNTLAD